MPKYYVPVGFIVEAKNSEEAWLKINSIRLDLDLKGCIADEIGEPKEIEAKEDQESE